jgi:calcium channel MID1
MRPPTLDPLQRFAAFLLTSVMLLMLSSTFSSHHFAYAADVDSIRSEDHNHERLPEMDVVAAQTENLESRADEGYEADFLGYDRGIIGRAPTLDVPTELINNIPIVDNLVQGQTNYYTFPRSELGLRVRSTDNGEGDPLEEIVAKTDPAGLGLEQRATTPRAVYISVNVCLQPRPKEATTVDPPPQLQLYISQTTSNPNPGPGSKGAQEMVDLVGGATMQMVNATGDIYISLYGSDTTAYADVWNTQVAASTDAFYHSYLNSSVQNLRLVDSDSSAALLVSGNITNANSSSPEFQAVMDAAPPYVLFVSSSENRLMQGLQNSYCGLQQNADIRPVASGESAGVQTSLTTRADGAPKQQFYLTGIHSATTYQAALVSPSGVNSTSHGPGVVGGGGQVWPVVNFTTLSGISLQILLKHG